MTEVQICSKKQERGDRGGGYALDAGERRG
jgi:hypothetical protein